MYGSWEVTTPATCQAKGEETRTCACGESETRSIAKNAHTYGSWEVTTPATCQANGEETRTCACGESETRTTAIDNTAHTFNKQVVSDVYLKAPATTTTSAQYYYSCACGAKGTESFVYGDVLTIPAESVTLDKTQCTLTVGSDVTLVATVNPANATDKSVTWTSSNTSIATVSNGIVTAINEGTATITVETANGRTATCTVTVEKPKSLDYLLSADETYYIVSGIGTWTSSKIEIPDTYNGLPVKEIGNRAFLKNTNIVSVKFGNNVEIIRSNAFYGCTYLNIVVFTPSLKAIEATAFYNCTSLEKMNLEAAINLKKIGDRAFGYCSSLTEITIPAGVQTMEGKVFENCTSLKTVNWQENNDFSNFTGCAFINCISLENVTIPFVGMSRKGDGYTNFGSIFGAASYKFHSTYVPVNLKNVVILGGDTIPEYAFYSCTNIENITIPDSVTEIKSAAFYDCSKLTSITIPNSVTSILDYAFYNCDGLTNITVPDNVTTLYSYVFNSCNNLENITIGNGVTSIGSYAFLGCNSFTSIVIPDSVTSIGSSAFLGCNSLESITLPFVGATLNGTKNTHFGYIFGASSYSDNDDYVPASLKEVIITGSTSIGDYAFYRCKSLTSIEIPDSVTSIGSNAFYSCKSLTSIVIPDSVTSIGYWAFNSCISLTSVTIGNGVTSIDHSFQYCTSLTSITIPKSVKSIGSTAFYACQSLVEVYNLSSLNVSSYFSNEKIIHTSLEEESILEAVDDYVFMTWEGKYYLVKYIGTDTEIVLPENYNGNDYAIYNNAFYNCDSLTSITIPDSVTSIGDYVFYMCRNLTSITYRGTTSQWNAISKGWGWSYDVPAQSVICSNGSVSI